jgi:hypothetical protein
VSFTVNDEKGDDPDDLRVFAGPRWDPFFTDAAALVETITVGHLAFKQPRTIMADGKNVLSIVVEVDCDSSATVRRWRSWQKRSWPGSFPSAGSGSADLSWRTRSWG